MVYIGQEKRAGKYYERLQKLMVSVMLPKDSSTNREGIESLQHIEASLNERYRSVHARCPESKLIVRFAPYIWEIFTL